MKTYTNICPVCGFGEIPTPVKEYDMCPCCLFEFYVNDVDATYAELREDWVQHGAQWAWGSAEIPQPPHWSARKQLLNINSNGTESDLAQTTQDCLAPALVA